MIEGPRSLAWVQAENRLHVGKAILEHVVTIAPEPWSRQRSPVLARPQQKLRVAPGSIRSRPQVGPEEYFVLSRIDGAQTLRDVLLATGLPVDRGIAIVMKLRSIGALLLPGETGTPAPAAAPAAERAPAGILTPVQPMTPVRGVGIVPPPRPPILDMPTQRLPPSLKGVQLDAPTTRRPGPPRRRRRRRRHRRQPGARSRAARRRAPTSSARSPRTIELADAERRRDPRDGAAGRRRAIRTALLGVPADADAKTLKRAYFKLSKEIHPDRFYGQQLGSFAKRIAERVRGGQPRVRAADRRPTRRGRAARIRRSAAEQPQTPQEYAAELFERACRLEISGDALEAMKLFAAAVRIDPPAALPASRRELRARRAVSRKTRGRVREEGPDASRRPIRRAARLLATAFRAAGKLADAEEVLVMAMALKSENDVLTAELRNDLAEVRRLLANPQTP